MRSIKILLLSLFVVGLLSYLNIILPKAQVTDAHVTDHNHTDSCGLTSLTVAMQGDGCTSFYKTGNNYATGAQVTNNTGHAINAVLHWDSFFCTSQSDLTSSGACLKNKKTFSKTVSIPAHSSITYATPTLHPADYGSFNSCGLFQNDFWYSYADNGKTCESTLNGTGTGFGYAGDGYCKMWDGVHWPKWECTAQPTTHRTCQNNACVTVSGSGTSTCNSNAECQPQTHKMCQNNACAVVSGPGADTCTQNADCQPQTHLTCVNNTCTKVTGSGSNTCATEGSSCSNEIQHFACLDNACRLVPGSGPSTCSSNNDCTTPTHKACSNNACVVVQGSGSDSCSTDNDCKQPTHRACVSNACTVVVGSGSDSCAQDSDCQTQSCSGTNCGDINITVEQHQEQQQQQQQVLGASVAPAVNSSQLPSTGAGADILLSLVGLIPLGLKLRKLV